jgi:hypothetical protein
MAILPKKIMRNGPACHNNNTHAKGDLVVIKNHATDAENK